MASSRNRPLSDSQPSDRRMRVRRPSRTDRRMQAPPDQRKRQWQRLIIGVVVLLIIGGIVGYGYYEVFVKPNQVLAARVGDVRYTQGDLVKRMRMLNAAGSGQDFDFARVPFETLIGMADAEIIRRFAPEFNVHVTDDDIELGLINSFYPRIPEGQEVAPGQADAEYRENYQRFLTNSHLSDSDYRQIVAERIYRALLRAELGEKIPSIGEQVEIHWIKLPDTSRGGGALPGLDANAPPINPVDIIARLDDEDFETVAAEVSRPGTYSNEVGYVGWVPRGAFPAFEGILFGDDEQEPLAIGEVSDAIYDTDGAQYIIKKSGGPEVREIAEIMRKRLTDQALDDWLQEKKTRGGEEGWLELNFSQELYQWANEQVKEAAPRSTPSGSGSR